MANEKLIAGAVMILLNLVVLAPIATSMVEGAVEDNFETWPYDEACADSDCTTAEEDWATSTSDRSYYAWNLTNADEVMAGEDPVYEMLGPFDYEITTTRNIIAFDKEAGTLTYDESKVFTCAMDDPEACNTPITQLNIPSNLRLLGQQDWLLKESWIRPRLPLLRECSHKTLRACSQALQPLQQ